MSSAWISNRRVLLIAMLLLSALPKLNAEQNYLNGLPNTNSCCRSWNISADFLAWYASEEVTSIWADVITVGSNTSSWEALSFNFKWDYGFRIGALHSLAYDHWDTAFYWTWFHTDAKHTIDHSPNTTIIPEFFAAFLSGNSPRSMSVKWRIYLNMFDWELGRRYCICKGLSFRPFLGLKGGWINQSIHGQYYDLTIDKVLTDNSAQERLKNNFWGIGTIGGINTEWRLFDFRCHFFDFFGDFSMATMLGTWSCSDEYNNTALEVSTVSMKNSMLGALMFRGFMGIKWDGNPNAGRLHFSSKLGYEMQLWLNQLRIATFQLQRLHGDLSFQGITLNCRFDF